MYCVRVYIYCVLVYSITNDMYIYIYIGCGRSRHFRISLNYTSIEMYENTRTTTPTNEKWRWQRFWKRKTVIVHVGGGFYLNMLFSYCARKVFYRFVLCVCYCCRRQSGAYRNKTIEYIHLLLHTYTRTLQYMRCKHLVDIRVCVCVHV